MTRFIANVPACDYLSVGTFNPKVSDWLVKGFVDNEQQPEDTQRMQYVGWIQSFVDGSFFWGSGDQNGHIHHLHQVSGAAADRFLDLLLQVKSGEFNVTRIDLQITVPKPEWYKSRSFVDTMRGEVWQGRRRKVTSIDNYGDDTVYIGSRKSDRFARLYVKETDWLRFEFEYKKTRADNVFRLIHTHGREKTLGGLLRGEVLQMPDHPIKTLYAAVLGEVTPLQATVEKPESQRFKWFVKQCTPAIVTLLRDHDSRGATRQILQDLLNGDYDNEW